MYKQAPKFRKQLNQNQIETLRILYKYRFASRDLIAKYFNKKDAYRQLLVLEDRGFIGRRYDTSYKLAGRPAAYYLKPDGMRALQSADETINEIDMRKLYKAEVISEEFIDHCMTILTISLQLRIARPTVKFFTKIDLQKDAYSYFPSPLPDAYIRIDSSQYFLNYFDSSKPLFAIIRWLKLLVEYYENGAWDDTGAEFPVIVVVLEDGKYMKKLTRFLEANLDDMNIRLVLKSEILEGALSQYRGIQPSETNAL